jgi:hypothetical protein
MRATGTVDQPTPGRGANRRCRSIRLRDPEVRAARSIGSIWACHI